MFMEESLYDRTTTQPNIEAIFEACDINRHTPRKRIKDQLDCLLGLFVKKAIKVGSPSEHVYTAIHDKMFDFLCYYFGNYFQKAFIKHVDMKVLYERARLECVENRTCRRKEFSILIDEKNEHAYFERVFKNFPLGENPELFNFLLRHDKEFSLKLCQYIQQLNDDVVQKYCAMVNENGMCLLLYAVDLEDICLVRVLIEKGVNVNPEDTKQTPLTENFNYNKYAVECDGYDDKLKIMKILIDKEASVNKINSEGNTPLMACLYFIHSMKYKCLNNVTEKEMIQQLLDNGANVNTSNKSGITPLNIACDIGKISLLIERGADVNPGNDDLIQTPLSASLGYYKYSSYEELCRIIQLFVANDAYVGKVIRFDNSSLIYFLEIFYDILFSWSWFSDEAPMAAYDNLKLLLDKGAEVNSFTKDGVSPLVVLLERISEDYGHRKLPDKIIYKTFNLLIDKGASVNFVDADGTTPLKMACAIGDICLIKLLIQNKADINSNNENFITAGLRANYFGYESTRKQYETVELLERANECITSDRQKYGLWWYPEKEIESLVKFLIARGSNENPDNDDLDQTPLTAACSLEINKVFYVHNRIIKLLLDKGANINKSDRRGMSSIEAARKAGNINLIDFLIKNGADVTFCQENMKSLFFEAIDKSEDLDDYDLLKVLLDKGVNVNTSDCRGKTPLTIACKNSDISLMKFLIEKKAQIELNNTNIITSYLKADPCKSEISLDYFEIVELLLDRRVKISEINKSEVCRDIGAAEEINSLVKFLVERRFEENHIYEDHDESILVEVCKIEICREHRARIKIIEMLLNEGFNINKLNKDGMYPLAAACRSVVCSEFPNIDLIKFLIKNGATVNSISIHKYSEIYNAWSHLDNPSRELLLFKGKDEYTVNESAECLLILACKHGDTDMIKFITNRVTFVDFNHANLVTLFLLAKFESLKNNVTCEAYEIVETLSGIQEDINTVDEKGNSPLAIACGIGDLRLVKLLIGIGASVNPDKTKLKYTPLIVACIQAGHYKNHTYYEIIQLLFDRGADINEESSAFSIAISLTDLKLITLLMDNGADVPPNYAAFVDNFLRQNNVPCLQALDWLQMEMFQCLLKKEAEKAKEQRGSERRIFSTVAKRKKKPKQKKEKLNI